MEKIINFLHLNINSLFKNSMNYSKILLTPISYYNLVTMSLILSIKKELSRILMIQTATILSNKAKKNNNYKTTITDSIWQIMPTTVLPTSSMEPFHAQSISTTSSFPFTPSSPVSLSEQDNNFMTELSSSIKC